MQEVKNNKVAFFFPGYKFGGVELLYIRIALELIKEGCEVEIIDYVDGTLSKELKYTAGVQVVPYENHSNFNTKSEICITSLKYLPHGKNIFPKNLKLIFWDEHPYNLIHYLKFSRILKWFGVSMFYYYSSVFNRNRILHCHKNLEIAGKKDGLAFMCYYNYWLNQKYFSINKPPYYVQIPIDSKKSKWGKKIDDTKINISYLGRIDSDKHQFCTELMADVINYNIKHKHKLCLHIIGNGNRFSLVENIANKYPNYFILKGIIKGDALHDFMLSNIDLAFAVGTSGLESAALGIPTVFMRGFNKLLKNRYLWIFNTKHYEVSFQYYQYKNDPQNVFSLSQLIDRLQNEAPILSKRSIEYVSKNHLITSTISRLKILIKKSQLTSSDLY